MALALLSIGFSEQIPEMPGFAMSRSDPAALILRGDRFGRPLFEAW